MRSPRCFRRATESMPQIGYAHRQAPMGHGGMVASCHPLASLAGVEVLKSGGTAADAAIAINAVLAVTQPNYCGLGGDLFCLYYEAATRRVHALNGAGRSGSRAGLDELGRRGLSAVPMIGPGAVSVPGVTLAWTMLLERFGTRSLKTLLEPALRYALDGFPISDVVCQAIRERAKDVTDAEWHRVFAPGGVFPLTGQRFRQPDLGRTLALLGEEPDLFYRGRVARAISERLRADGFVTAGDLASHDGEWGEPLATTYRRHTIYETQPPTQGLATLLTLNLLEGFDVASYPVHSVEHLHLLIEMTKLAYADRDRWVADPVHTELPLAALLDKEYAARRRAAFDPGKAQMYKFGDLDGGTTGFAVADDRGNVASVIQSIYKSFGSTVVPPGTGVVLHNRGGYFNTDPAHPNCFAPRKHPFHTLLACIVTRDDRPALGYATMGGDGQAMFHTQTLTNLLDYGMEIQEAIERPRFVCGPLDPGDVRDRVRIEGRVAPAVRERLGELGHHVEVVSDWFARMGHAHGITLREGTLRGGADPRGDGAAIGY
ncbi:MAG: gamma-glutamyltransferase [Candidatus Rokuibacteriota bacterium]|nr:MAG: gamma-glutamyltransferase [Candidatus Rokubacteria bacterium]